MDNEATVLDLVGRRRLNAFTATSTSELLPKIYAAATSFGKTTFSYYPNDVTVDDVTVGDVTVDDVTGMNVVQVATETAMPFGDSKTSSQSTFLIVILSFLVLAGVFFIVCGLLVKSQALVRSSSSARATGTFFVAQDEGDGNEFD